MSIIRSRAIQQTIADPTQHIKSARPKQCGTTQNSTQQRRPKRLLLGRGARRRSARLRAEASNREQLTFGQSRALERQGLLDIARIEQRGCVGIEKSWIEASKISAEADVARRDRIEARSGRQRAAFKRLVSRQLVRNISVVLAGQDRRFALRRTAGDGLRFGRRHRALTATARRRELAFHRVLRIVGNGVELAGQRRILTDFGSVGDRVEVTLQRAIATAEQSGIGGIAAVNQAGRCTRNGSTEVGRGPGIVLELLDRAGLRGIVAGRSGGDIIQQPRDSRNRRRPRLRGRVLLLLLGCLSASGNRNLLFLKNRNQDTTTLH